VKVIVDTSIWSLAFRRHKATASEATVLGTLLRDDDAVLLGVVRQELLTGVREADRFRLLRDTLRKLPDYPLVTEHYEVAAEASNICRAKGVQGSNVDFLLCALSQLDRLAIFTTDNDFAFYAKHLPIMLFKP
jgi:predicted nucleic acid-binding protein